MGGLTLWSLDRERPAALVVAAARIAGGDLSDRGSIVRGLRIIARLEGWPGRLASYLLARPRELEEALKYASTDGEALRILAEEIVKLARRQGS